MGLKGLWGVEVYNTGCYRGGQHDTVQSMVDMLRTNERVMPVAADDTHVETDTFGGWLMAQGKLVAVTFGVLTAGFLLLRIAHPLLWAAVISKRSLRVIWCWILL